MEETGILIIGAGPIGLACGIEAKRAGFEYVIADKGGLCESIRRFPSNMTFFSTTEKLEIGGLPFTITGTRPTRAEALIYYRKVAEFHALELRLHHPVAEVARLSQGGFQVRFAKGAELKTRHVIMATGYFDHPNAIDVPGEELPHVFHYYDEPYAYAHCRCLVVGGRNSAVDTALDLYRHGAHVTFLHRGEQLGKSVKYWIRPDLENRIREGSIAGHYESRIRKIMPKHVEAENLKTGQRFRLDVDFVFLMTGYRPDTGLLQSAGVELDENLRPRHDALTFETNIPGLFVAGSTTVGRHISEIFIENSRHHGEAIVGYLRSLERG